MPSTSDHRWHAFPAHRRNITRSSLMNTRNKSAHCSPLVIHPPSYQQQPKSKTHDHATNHPVRSLDQLMNGSGEAYRMDRHTSESIDKNSLPSRSPAHDNTCLIAMRWVASGANPRSTRAHLSLQAGSSHTGVLSISEVDCNIQVMLQVFRQMAGRAAAPD